MKEAGILTFADPMSTVNSLCSVQEQGRWGSFTPWAFIIMGELEIHRAFKKCSLGASVLKEPDSQQLSPISIIVLC